MTAALPIGVFECDANLRLVTANDAFRNLVLDGAAVAPGSAPWSHARAAVRTECEHHWVAHRGDPSPFTVDFPVESAAGEVWVRINAVARLDGGRIIAHVGTAVDVTPAVAQTSVADRLVGLLDVTGEAIVIFDRTGALTFANSAAREMLGISSGRSESDEVATRTYGQAVRDQVPRGILSPAPRDAPGHWHGEVSFRSPDGLALTLEVTVQVVRDRSGALEQLATVARDISAERQARAELDRLATHDALTGLPNRVLFLRRAADALERAATTGARVAVLFVDLDKLKHVNDTIGHAVGDQLIVQMARRLATATRPSDTVARIAGDEFAVLCEGILDEHVALEVAERVRSAVTGRAVLQGVEVETGASVGVALSGPGQAVGPARDAAVALLHDADTAMYLAKARGRGRCEVYSDEMRRATRERAALAAELEQALAGGQFEVRYQPIELAHGGRIVGVEAFLRWNHPDRGHLPPSSFLDLADESGLIGPVGDWVLDRACTDLAGWERAGLGAPGLALHVNVSRRQLADTTFVERTLAIIGGHGLDAARLVCETSEATLVDANPAVLRTVNALNRAGVRIAVDDFGSGYSSLSALRTFPADLLKIDGTLVRDVGRTDGGDDPMVRSIIQLAHSLGLGVCAEWVTTDDQLDRLRVLGCDLVQGNRVGAVVTPRDLAARLGAEGSTAGLG